MEKLSVFIFRFLIYTSGTAMVVVFILSIFYHFNPIQKKEDEVVIDKSLPLNKLLIVVEKRIMFQDKETNAPTTNIKLQMQDSVKKYTKLLVGKDSLNYNWDDMYPPIGN